MNLLFLGHKKQARSKKKTTICTCIQGEVQEKNGKLPWIGLAVDIIDGLCNFGMIHRAIVEIEKLPIP